MKAMRFENHRSRILFQAKAARMTRVGVMRVSDQDPRRAVRLPYKSVRPKKLTGNKNAPSVMMDRG